MEVPIIKRFLVLCPGDVYAGEPTPYGGECIYTKYLSDAKLVKLADRLGHLFYDHIIVRGANDIDPNWKHLVYVAEDHGMTIIDETKHLSSAYQFLLWFSRSIKRTKNTGS